MDYPAILAEITDNAAAYKGMSDDQIAAILEAKTLVITNSLVPIISIMDYLRANALWLQIKAAASAGTSIGAMAAVDLNNDLRAVTLDMSLPVVQQMMADLVAQKLLTQVHVDFLNTLGNTAIPFARHADETISADVVARARLGDVEGIFGVGLVHDFSTNSMAVA